MVSRLGRQHVHGNLRDTGPRPEQPTRQVADGLPDSVEFGTLGRWPRFACVLCCLHRVASIGLAGPVSRHSASIAQGLQAEHRGLRDVRDGPRRRDPNVPRPFNPLKPVMATFVHDDRPRGR